MTTRKGKRFFPVFAARFATTDDDDRGEGNIRETEKNKAFFGNLVFFISTTNNANESAASNNKSYSHIGSSKMWESWVGIFFVFSSFRSFTPPRTKKVKQVICSLDLVFFGGGGGGASVLT